MLLIAISLLNTIYAQSYFDLTKDYPSPGNQNYLADLKNIKKYSYSEVKQAFDFILKSDLQSNYPQGGCQNRAQFMSLLLEKNFKYRTFQGLDFFSGRPLSEKLNIIGNC